LMSNGKYKTSAISGITAADNTNQFNSRSFESGLLDLSKKEFSTNLFLYKYLIKFTNYLMYTLLSMI